MNVYYPTKKNIISVTSNPCLMCIVWPFEESFGNLLSLTNLLGNKLLGFEAISNQYERLIKQTITTMIQFDLHQVNETFFLGCFNVSSNLKAYPKLN